MSVSGSAQLGSSLGAGRAGASVVVMDGVLRMSAQDAMRLQCEMARSLHRVSLLDPHADQQHKTACI